MDFLEYKNELQKLKRKELVELLEQKYNKICVLNEMVSEIDAGIAWTIWCDEFRPDNVKATQTYYVSQIKYALEEKTNSNLFSTKHLAAIIAGSDLIIEAYKQALVKLNSPAFGRKRIGVKKSVTVTLPEEYWKKINEICNEKKIKLGSFFRDLVIKEFDS